MIFALCLKEVGKMVSPISQTAAVSVTAEVVSKSSGSTSQDPNGVVESEVAEQISSRLDDDIQAPKSINAGKESAAKERTAAAPGEVRKSDVKNGEMRTKVYDRKGNLLRVIPPGYIPVGEKRFDVTV